MKTATIQDLERALPMAQKFYEDCQFPSEFDGPYFLSVWGKIIESGLGRIYIREHEGEIVEAIGVIIADGTMCKIRTATVQFWFVGGKPGLASGLLFNSMLQAVTEIGVQFVHISALVRYRYDAMKKFLMKSGFEPREVAFERALSC